MAALVSLPPLVPPPLASLPLLFMPLAPMPPPPPPLLLLPFDGVAVGEDAAMGTALAIMSTHTHIQVRDAPS